jgi:tight adherence protein C
MNLEFLLAISFGIGVAGVISQVFRKPSVRLSNRVVPAELRTTSHTQVNQLIRAGKSLSSALSTGSRKKSDKALYELPEVLELLVVSLSAGDGIYRAFATVVPRCDGELASELEKVLKSVDYGAAFGEEIRSVALALPTPQIAEFTSKVALALERGTPLAKMLSEQSQSARAEIRNRLLRQAGKNETRMLIPLVFLILPITVLFAIYPSLELLNFGFI